MSDENNNGRSSAPGGRQPLTLRPRGAGSVSAGTVKQSFSHGRSKTVVVETKRPRTHTAPAGNLAAPSAAERQRTAPAPAAPQAPAGRGAQPGAGRPADRRRRGEGTPRPPAGDRTRPPAAGTPGRRAAGARRG